MVRIAALAVLIALAAVTRSALLYYLSGACLVVTLFVPQTRVRRRTPPGR